MWSGLFLQPHFFETGGVIMEENKMGTQPINKLLINMSLPIVASMLVQALYNIVDSMFIGHYSQMGLAAVSLAFPFQNLMIAVGTGTGVGMNAVLSKYLGEKNYKGANIAAGNGFILSAISALVFAMLSIFGSEFYFSIQNPNPEIVEYGKQYLWICGGLSFGVFGQVIFERMLQATGKTLYTMFSQGIGAIINIILDPIMIFGLWGFPEMGVAGAALATVTGQIIAMLVALFFNVKKNDYIKLTKQTMKLNKKIVSRIYSVGVPSILMVAIGSVMTFTLNKILTDFDHIKTIYGEGAGTIAVTVFGVYFKLQSFVFMPIFGLNNGMVPIIAYNYGAKNRERIFKTLKLSIFYAVSIMLIGFAVFQIIPDKLLALFNSDPALVKMGVVALRTISYCFIFAGFCIVTGSMFQALGKGKYSLMMSAARQLLFLLPIAYMLSLTHNIDLIWIAFPAAELVAVALCIYYTKRIFKKMDF